MKKVDLGQSIGILANVGVIAGIVFLVIELQQNNELLEAQARSERNQRVMNLRSDIYSNPVLAEILVKIRNGETLTEAEQFQADFYALRRINGLEAQYLDFLAGTVDSPSIEALRFIFRGGNTRQPLADVWESSKPSLNADFVRWMEENVVNER